MTYCTCAMSSLDAANPLLPRPDDAESGHGRAVEEWLTIHSEQRIRPLPRLAFLGKLT